MVRSDGRILTLEALRGLAAVFVALFHLGLAGHLQASGITQGWFLFVDFFFVLSGFVLTHAYLGRLRGRSELLSFAIRRFGRLWPLHAVLLGLLVGLEAVRWLLAQHGLALGASPPFTGPRTLWSIATNLLLVQSLGMHDCLTWNLPSWSISVECAAYAVFAVVAACISRTAWAAVAIVVSSAGLLFVGSDTMDRTFDLGLLRCLYGFFLGHLASLAFGRIGMGTLPKASLCEVAAITGAVLFVSLAGRSAVGLAAPLVFVPVVLVFAFQQGAVSRALHAGIFQFLGRLSYSIYMVHLLVLLAISYAVKIVERLTAMRFGVEGDAGQGAVISFGPPLVDDLSTICYIAVVVALSAFTYRFIERPGQDWFNGLAARVRIRGEAGPA